MARDLPDTLLERPDTNLNRPNRWADLRLRFISAIILVPVGLLCLWASPLSWAALLAVAAIGLALEWIALNDAVTGRAAPTPTKLLSCAVLLLALGLAAAGQVAWSLLFLAFATLLMRVAARAWTIAAGTLYIGVPLVALAWVRTDPTAGTANLLFLLLIIWSGDIGAYLAGRWFGGPKLAPRISPGKTWSGAAGGLLASIATGAAIARILDGDLAAWVLVAAALIAIAGQLGDLLESAIKRRAGVKDSGRSIPGHGGLLDRFDAILTATPVAALLALSAGPGAHLWR